MTPSYLGPLSLSYDLTVFFAQLALVRYCALAHLCSFMTIFCFRMETDLKATIGVILEFEAWVSLPDMLPTECGPVQFHHVFNSLNWNKFASWQYLVNTSSAYRRHCEAFVTIWGPVGELFSFCDGSVKEKSKQGSLEKKRWKTENEELRKQWEWWVEESWWLPSPLCVFFW